MRTTITLDADVAELVADAMHRDRASMKQVVNAALRSALGREIGQDELYVTEVHHAKLAPGLDLAGFNRLADELEDEAILAKIRRDFP